MISESSTRVALGGQREVSRLVPLSLTVRSGQEGKGMGDWSL